MLWTRTNRKREWIDENELFVYLLTKESKRKKSFEKIPKSFFFYKSFSLRIPPFCFSYFRYYFLASFLFCSTIIVIVSYRMIRGCNDVTFLFFSLIHLVFGYPRDPWQTNRVSWISCASVSALVGCCVLLLFIWQWSVEWLCCEYIWSMVSVEKNVER